MCHLFKNKTKQNLFCAGISVSGENTQMNKSFSHALGMGNLREMEKGLYIPKTYTYSSVSTG